MKRFETKLRLVKGPIPHFRQMVILSKAIVKYIVNELGSDYFLDKISDPIWFSCFSAILGIEHFTSGSTTAVLKALKQGLKNEDLDLYIAGGKGKEGVNTPSEIKEIVKKHKLDLDTNKLIEISKLTAKVDNNCIQDIKGSIYFHMFFFDKEGNWSVVQQKMCIENKEARRYQWYNVDNLIEEPHKYILGNKKDVVIDLTSKKSKSTREFMVELINEALPSKLKKEIEFLKFMKEYKELAAKNKIINLPKRINDRILRELKEKEPQTFKELLMTKGVGPSLIRGLALVSYLIYGNKLSLKDPAMFYIAFGSKAGVPYKMQRKDMIKVAYTLENIIEMSKLEKRYKVKALRRLARFINRMKQE